MSDSISLVLGYHANLINGMKPDWTQASSTEGQLFSPLKPLQINPIDIRNSNFDDVVFDTYVKISLHFSWSELLEGIYKCWNVVDNGLQGNSSTLVVGEPTEDEIEEEISQKLAIKPEDASGSQDVGYALVALRKSAVSKAYDGISQASLSQELRDTLNDLPTDQTAVEPFLNFYDNYGTHYVSQLELGEVIYQVFVYEKSVLTEISKRFKPQQLVSPASSSFRQFTQPKTTYSGYSKYAGKICTWSNDAAINNVAPMLKDTVNNVESSIFMFLESDTYTALLDNFKNIIPISCKLTSIASLSLNPEQGQIFDNSFRNALYQKYETRINPEFPEIVEPLDYKSIYASFVSPFVSTIATSVMTVNQIWVDLKDIVTQNPEYVKLLFIFCDVAEIYEDVSLPGESVVIICRKFIAHDTQNKAPELFLSEKGYSSFTLYCNSFDGTMVAKKAANNEHKTYSSGKSMKSVTLSNMQLSVTNDGDHLQNPPLEIFDQLGDRLLNVLNLPLLSAQNIINYQTSEDALSAAKFFTQWMVDILAPADETRPTMVEVRTQAVLLLKSLKNSPGSILTVPYLTYIAYQPSIDAMMKATDAYYDVLQANTIQIQMRKGEETIYNSLDEINKNIQETGKFLIAQNEAMVANEQDIVNYFNEVNAKQQEMLTMAQSNVAKLATALEEQQQVVNDSYSILEKQIEAYIVEQVFKAAFEVATAVMSMFIGGYSLKNLDAIAAAPQDIAAIQKLLKKVDAIMKLIDGVTKLYNSVGNDVRNAINITNALTNVPDGTNVPTTEDWNEFDASVYAVISPITKDIPYANTYLKETKILSSRGRALIDATSQVSKLEYDMLLNGWQTEVSQKQQKRLDDLSSTLNQPDLTPLEASEIDLLEIGSVYQSHADRIVLQLVKTLGLQDAALQYYYLQPPTPIMDYNILSIKETIIDQANKSITALESFNPKPATFSIPVEYVLSGISVSQLISSTDTPDTAISLEGLSTYTKNGVDFAIPLDTNQFINYVRVRIDSIIIDISGIKSTNSGRLNVHLTAFADPYYDRGLKRETLEFTSVQQEYDYVYELATGKCVFGNQPSDDFGQYYMKMTPFTRWRLTLPMGEANENYGIVFTSDTVDIKLSFYGEAIRLNKN